MKITIVAILIFLRLVPEAMAAEPDERPVAMDHKLGRVFLSSVERRQLDLMRRSPPQTERAGLQRSAAQPAESQERKKAIAAGYIVPSNGSPYQWIDGDFRHVTQAEVDATSISSSISITRHRYNSVSDDESTEREEAATLAEDQKPDVEAGSDNRRLQ